MLVLFSKFSIILGCCALISSCAVFPSHVSNEESQTIENPFGKGFSTRNSDEKNITLRTRQGEHAVEVEISPDQANDLSMPLNPHYTFQTEDGIDHHYASQKATVADREIASTFGTKDDPATNARKREIETTLGLQESDDLPSMDESYLAKVDLIKQFFSSGRYEAALIEIDRLLRAFPTNARLFEMRGTVLDRLGYSPLALKSWKQALEFDPSRLGLKKIIEKREQIRK